MSDVLKEIMSNIDNVKLQQLPKDIADILQKAESYSKGTTNSSDDIIKEQFKKIFSGLKKYCRTIEQFRMLEAENKNLAKNPKDYIKKLTSLIEQEMAARASSDSLSSSGEKNRHQHSPRITTKSITSNTAENAAIKEALDFLKDDSYTLEYPTIEDINAGHYRILTSLSQYATDRPAFVIDSRHNNNIPTNMRHPHTRNPLRMEARDATPLLQIALAIAYEKGIDHEVITSLNASEDELKQLREEGLKQKDLILKGEFKITVGERFFLNKLGVVPRNHPIITDANVQSHQPPSHQHQQTPSSVRAQRQLAHDERRYQRQQALAERRHQRQQTLAEQRHQRHQILEDRRHQRQQEFAERSQQRQEQRQVATAERKSRAEQAKMQRQEQRQLENAKRKTRSEQAKIQRQEIRQRTRTKRQEQRQRATLDRQTQREQAREQRQELKQRERIQRQAQRQRANLARKSQREQEKQQRTTRRQQITSERRSQREQARQQRVEQRQHSRITQREQKQHSRLEQRDQKQRVKLIKSKSPVQPRIRHQESSRTSGTASSGPPLPRDFFANERAKSKKITHMQQDAPKTTISKRVPQPNYPASSTPAKQEESHSLLEGVVSTCASFIKNLFGR